MKRGFNWSGFCIDMFFLVIIVVITKFITNTEIQEVRMLVIYGIILFISFKNWGGKMKVKCMESKMGLYAGMDYEIESETGTDYEIFGFYFPKSMFILYYPANPATAPLIEVFEEFRRIFGNV